MDGAGANRPFNVRNIYLPSGTKCIYMARKCDAVGSVFCFRLQFQRSLIIFFFYQQRKCFHRRRRHSAAIHTNSTRNCPAEVSNALFTNASQMRRRIKSKLINVPTENVNRNSIIAIPFLQNFSSKQNYYHVAVKQSTCACAWPPKRKHCIYEKKKRENSSKMRVHKPFYLWGNIVCDDVFRRFFFLPCTYRKFMFSSMIFTWPHGRALSQQLLVTELFAPLALVWAKSACAMPKTGPDITYAYDFNESITWHTNG